MTVGLEDAIRKELRKNHVTFAELTRIEGFSGDFEIIFPEYDMVLWSGVSEEAIDILHRLEKAGEFHFHPTTFLTYLADGRALTYPIVERAQHYAKPHWLPVVLNLGPDPNPKRNHRRRPPARSGSITRRFGGEAADA